MPPPSQKGKGTKGAARDIRQSRSRNTTPSLTGAAIPPTETGVTAYLELSLHSFRASDDLVESYGSAIPSSKELEALLERLQRLVDVVEARGSICDKGMRMLAQARKDRVEEIENDLRDEERKERIKREVKDEEERVRTKANKLKKKKDAGKEERPLTHGAHGLAPQDGSQLDPSSPSRESRKSRAASRDIDSASSSLSPVAPATPAATGMDIDMKNDDDDSSSDEHQPKPAPTIPHHQTFGDDPSTFPDPTIYEILPVTDDMTDEEKKKIYSVEVFPHDNLEELIPGIPPDKDFSIAKPTNQVQANTFATYIEPYFRDFNEEDLAFLRERGDRVQCMVIPKRGKRHYTEVWLEEDGALSIDTPQQGRDKLSPNQARGNIDAMDDASAETDSVSVGPLLSRLLSTMKPERRVAPEEKSSANGLTNGELNGDTNGDFDASQPPDGPAPVPPASYMADSNSDAWKKATHHKLDHLQVEQRLKQELRHIGFLAQDAEPDYDAHFDDDIAARLRLLQLKLKEAIVQNGARKARLMELAKERLAYQEWKTILEDLDNQVCAAYAKRTRTMGKSKKTKRPGGAGGGSHYVGGAGMAKPGIGDNIKVLLDRRKKWIKLGQVFDSEFKVPRFKNKSGEDTSIFKPQDMGELMRKERESWDDDGEDE